MMFAKVFVCELVFETETVTSSAFEWKSPSHLRSASATETRFGYYLAFASARASLKTFASATVMLL